MRGRVLRLVLMVSALMFLPNVAHRVGTIAFWSEGKERGLWEVVVCAEEVLQGCNNQPPQSTLFRGWDPRTVYYDLSGLSAITDETKRSQAKAQMIAAFVEWNAALSGTGVVFKEATDAATKQLATEHGVPVTIGSVGGDYAITSRTGVSGLVFKAPMKFDLNNNNLYHRSQPGWSTIVKKVMLHEIGHSLGLDDVTPPDCSQQNGKSIMNAVCNVNGQPNDSEEQMPSSLQDCDKQRARVFTSSTPGGGGSTGTPPPSSGTAVGGFTSLTGCYDPFDCDGDGVSFLADCNDDDWDIGACWTRSVILSSSDAQQYGSAEVSDEYPYVMLHGAGLAPRNCSNYVEWSPVSKASLIDCLDYCETNGADACEWEATSRACYAEFGDGCQLEGTYFGWYGYLLAGGGNPGGGGSGGSGEMQQHTGIRGCSDYYYLPPVYKADAGACLSYCQGESADACEWHEASGDCYADFGSGCYVESGHGGWYSAVLNNDGRAAIAARAAANSPETEDRYLIITAAAVMLSALGFAMSLLVVAHGGRVRRFASAAAQ